MRRGGRPPGGAPREFRIAMVDVVLHLLAVRRLGGGVQVGIVLAYRLLEIAEDAVALRHIVEKVGKACQAIELTKLLERLFVFAQRIVPDRLRSQRPGPVAIGIGRRGTDQLEQQGDREEAAPHRPQLLPGSAADGDVAEEFCHPL